MLSQTPSLSAVSDRAKPVAGSRHFGFADTHGQRILVTTKHLLPLAMSALHETKLLQDQRSCQIDRLLRAMMFYEHICIQKVKPQGILFLVHFLQQPIA